MYDVIIIGGGAAGLTAAIYAARAGLKAIAFEKAFAGGQASTTNIIENYPGFPRGIGGPELMAEFEAQASAAGAETVYEEARDVRLDGAVKRVNGREGRAVIIASGARMRTLGVKGESENIGRGVSYCATCDGAFYRGREVAVVGGGNTAVEDVLYLSRFAKVHIIHRRSELRARGRQAERALAAADTHLGVTVSEIARADGKITLALSDGTALTVDGVFIAAGTVPETDMFRGVIDMDEAGYILAGEDTKTSVSGVFAAGDCRKKPLKQVITAASDGAVAATMAAEYINTL